MKHLPLVVALLVLSAPAHAEEEVLAKVGQDVISLKRFQEVVGAAPAELRAGIVKNKKQFLNDLVDQMLLARAGIAMGLDKDPLVVQQLQTARRQILANRVLQQKVFGATKVTPEEVRAFYEQNRQNFQTPERVRASHILVKEERMAKLLLTQLEAGADFAGLAQKHSIDPSKANGGDLGFFPRGRMVPPFESAAFALQEGQMSRVVKTQFGFHIILCTEKAPSRQREFAEVQEDLTQRMVADKRQKAMEALIADLRKQTPVQTNDALLEKVQ